MTDAVKQPTAESFDFTEGNREDGAGKIDTARLLRSYKPLII